MDRLPAVTSLALAVLACGKDAPAPPPPSRVEGAKVRERPEAGAAGFCDVHASDDSGPTLTFPSLVGPAPAALAPGHWRWLNIWATWCKPCIEELPLVARWRDKLATTGRPVDLTFVSIDESNAEVGAFRRQHPEMPESARLAESSKQATWFASLGLDAASPIPIHVFVSPAGHIRCVRAGGLSERDYATVEGLFAE
jgi:thiol-disulfide isomerase/thioredoxin